MRIRAIPEKSMKNTNIENSLFYRGERSKNSHLWEAAADSWSAFCKSSIPTCMSTWSRSAEVGRSRVLSVLWPSKLHSLSLSELWDSEFWDHSSSLEIWGGVELGSALENCCVNLLKLWFFKLCDLCVCAKVRHFGRDVLGWHALPRFTTKIYQRLPEKCAVYPACCPSRMLCD